MTYPVDPAQLQQFLAAERQQESGGNYTANNPGGASGAYQFEPATWAEWVSRAGFPQFARQPAATAPPSVQDAAATAMASSYFSSSGNWRTVAGDWYYPAGVNNPSIVPPGNVLSVGQYEADVLAKMGAASSSSSSSSPAQLTSIGGDLAAPVIGWLDNYAMRAALFIAGALAILAGLAHLTHPTEGPLAGVGGGGSKAPGAQESPKSGVRSPAEGQERTDTPAEESGGAEGDVSSTLEAAEEDV